VSNLQGTLAPELAGDGPRYLNLLTIDHLITVGGRWGAASQTSSSGTRESEM